MDNKTLTGILSKKLGISQDAVARLVEGLAEVVGECAADLDSVALPGLGVFEPRKRLERVALHPASGKRLLVPPKIVLGFKPTSVLRQKIKKGGEEYGK